VARDSSDEIVAHEPLVEWLADNYLSFGVELHVVSDCTGEGSQLVRGLSGIAAVLRWPLVTAVEPTHCTADVGAGDFDDDGFGPQDDMF
jgi:peptide chain release factor subunit 1